MQCEIRWRFLQLCAYYLLNEKLPELQVKDVELALNCILRQLADAKGLKLEGLVVLICIIDLRVLPVILKQVKRLIYRLK
jgi:hypothetical protein